MAIHGRAGSASCARGNPDLDVHIDVFGVVPRTGEVIMTEHRTLKDMEPLHSNFRRANRPPCISHKEIAALLGLSWRGLTMKIRNDPTAPKPLYATGGGRGVPRNTWYNLAEAKAWIASMKKND